MFPRVMGRIYELPVSYRAEARSASGPKTRGVRPRRARDGWAGPPGANRGLPSPHGSSSIRYTIFLSGGWVKTTLEGSLNRLERGAGSWCRGDTEERATCHVPPSPLSQRLCSVSTLVPRFASERRQFLMIMIMFPLSPFLAPAPVLPTHAGPDPDKY